MFGLGFSEILIIATLCILFIPPKDYPRLLIQIKKMFKLLGDLSTSLQRELMSIDYENEEEATDKKETK